MRYDELAPLLLNEVQQQHSQLSSQTQQLTTQTQQLGTLSQQLAELKAQNESLRTAVGQLQRRAEQQIASTPPGDVIAAVASLRPQ